MNKAKLNMDVINKVIAFKMLDILRENSIIEDNKYASIERKRLQYGESISGNKKWRIKCYLWKENIVSIRGREHCTP